MRAWNFFILIIVSLGILYGGFNAGVYSYIYYKKFQQNRALKKFQEEIKKQEEVEKQKLMADTYGGKTPEETLQMFIEAVEKGDYELASKYFVERKREEWKKALLKTSENDKINEFLNLIKQSVADLGKGYSNEIYIAEKPIYIELIRYPNGIWKLTDI